MLPSDANERIRDAYSYAFDCNVANPYGNVKKADDGVDLIFSGGFCYICERFIVRRR